MAVNASGDIDDGTVSQSILDGTFEFPEIVPFDIIETMFQVSGPLAMSASPKDDSIDEDSFLPPYQQPGEENGGLSFGLDSILKANIFTLEGELKTVHLKLRGLKSDVRFKNDKIMDLHDINTSILKE